MSAKISKMLKSPKIIYLIFSLSLIFSCSVEKPVTSGFIKENESNNEKNIKQDDFEPSNKFDRNITISEELSRIYLNFNDSNLELPEKLILERENSIEVINKKGNIQKKISFDKETTFKDVVKEKSLVIFVENNKKIRIINYDTNKELYIPLIESAYYFTISPSKEKMTFYSYPSNILYVADIYGNINKISEVEKHNSCLLYDNEKSILFVKNENNKRVLYSSDLKGNIKELTEIDALYDINSYSLSKDNKKIAFTYQGDVYSMNIDGSNKLRLTDKSKYNEDISFYSPKFSPDNKYIFYTKSKINSSREVYIVKSNSTPIILNEISSSFVGYTNNYSLQFQWLDNESFLFQKQIEWVTKETKIKILDLGDKLSFTELEPDIKIEDNKNLKIPEDYQLQVVKKSYDSKKIAYSMLNSKYYFRCSSAYTSSQFKIKYYDPVCYKFEKDTDTLKSFLYISDYDGKNEIKILEDKSIAFESLTKFSWSSDSRFLFVDYNSTLYVYSVEKNQLFKIDTDDDSFIHNIF